MEARHLGPSRGPSGAAYSARARLFRRQQFNAQLRSHVQPVAPAGLHPSPARLPRFREVGSATSLLPLHHRIVHMLEILRHVVKPALEAGC